MLLMAWTAQAQNSIKVVPTMKKGDVRTYEIEVSSNIPDSPVKMAQQSVYTVVDANSNGYVMDITYKEWTTNGESAGLACIFHTLGKKPLIDEWHTPAKAVFSFYDKSLQP